MRDGSVLIAGGLNSPSFSDYDTLRSAEVFDPATGAFLPAGNMGIARSHHTAIALHSGKVLVIGGTEASARAGEEDFRTLASAEVYDLANGMFTTTGSMAIARSGHTATLLPDGMVLVTGGVWDGGPRYSEVFDPSTGVFSPTGSMNVDRYGHTATLLPNGKVLIVGGSAALVRVLASAEIYDPSTGGFSLTGSIGVGRERHAATLLPNGKVLVTGGTNSDVRVVSSAELYDPSTGRFTTVAAMAGRRERHEATLLADGTGVLVTAGFGGLSGGGLTILRTAELYEPESGQ